jgi:hypothetical protein
MLAHALAVPQAQHTWHISPPSQATGAPMNQSCKVQPARDPKHSAAHTTVMQGPSDLWPALTWPLPAYHSTTPPHTRHTQAAA